MSDTVISVEDVSKSYLVGHQSDQRESYTALRDVLARGAKNFGRKAADFIRGRQIVQGDEVEEFWALRNINFKVSRGEVLGIIGRNGAGKSTLLKILSRITEPTRGRIVMRGRVASLLEVGTGFHPELTGRENIYLNGAILGMSRREIRSKFDEIVSFAEIERFLDTPVKRYSSGMYVRLAFAVAAHLEPEILVIDEVLAVGDAEFQKKCLGKIGEVSKQAGRTVLFVTHNMDAMLKICGRAMLLGSGQVEIMGAPREILSAYFKGQLTSDSVDLRNALRVNDDTSVAHIAEISFVPEKSSWSFDFGEELGFRLTVVSKRPMHDVEVAIGLYSVRGLEVASWTNRCADLLVFFDEGRSTFEIRYPGLRLLPGQYYFGIDIRSSRGSEDYIPNAFPIEVLASSQSLRLGAQFFGGALIPNVSLRKLER